MTRRSSRIRKPRMTTLANSVSPQCLNPLFCTFFIDDFCFSDRKQRKHAIGKPLPDREKVMPFTLMEELAPLMVKTLAGWCAVARLPHGRMYTCHVWPGCHNRSTSSKSRKSTLLSSRVWLRHSPSLGPMAQLPVSHALALIPSTPPVPAWA